MRRPVIYMNTGLRWNSIWSHSHELTRLLSGIGRVIYYEPPRLTNNRSPVLYEKNEFARPEGVEFHSMHRSFSKLGPSYFLAYQRDSTKHFQQHLDEVDVFVTYNIYELRNLYKAKKAGKKVIFIYADEYDVLTTIPYAKPFLRFSLKRFLKKADVVVATAKVLEQKARKHNRHVVYLPNAVNLDDRGHAKRHAQDMPAKHSKDGEFTVGFLGSVEDWVDYQLIVDAAAKLQGVRFEIIGDGSSLPAFRKAAAGLPIHFHGYVPHSKAYGIVSRWNAASIPFKVNRITNSVSPVKLFEYWLLKKPVLATPTIELSQFRKEILIVRDADDLAKGIYKLKSDKAYRNRLGEAGHALVMKKYNWQAYKPIYRSLLR